MDNFKIFVTDALSNYDKNMKDQKNLLKNAKSTTTIPAVNNMDKNKIYFLDENNKKIVEGNYEIISTYMMSNNLWTWGWSNPSIPKNSLRIITNLLKHGLDLDSNKDFFLKSELINSRFIITDPVQIDIHLAICSALSKIDNIYPIITYSGEDRAQYFELKSDDFAPGQLGMDIIKHLDTTDVRVTYIFMFDIKKI
jgi:hypothetical protein